MQTYQTTATVQDKGDLHVAGVPFQPGTQVQVTIQPAENCEDTLAAARQRMRDLFRDIKGFRNSPRIKREDLYDRGRVH